MPLISNKISTPKKSAQSLINPDLLRSVWTAKWCSSAQVTARASCVLLFRKTIVLETVPSRFRIHVTADQRYRLLVNGKPVVWGPARGDLMHWRFETLDIAAYLVPGKNVISAVVHFLQIEEMPVAQTSAQPAFLMQGDSDIEAVVNTPAGWKVFQNPAYSFSLDDVNALWSYCGVGPSEIMDANRHPWGWEGPGFDDSGWETATACVKGKAAPYGCSDAESNWWLVPRTIPMMEETLESFGTLVREDGILATGNWPLGNETLVIPPDSRVVLLIDHGHETCAFPEITLSGGTGATIKLSYAEALVDADLKPNHPNLKANRNIVEDRVLRGYSDTWKCDGGTNRLLRPLWWRTFRYVETRIQTHAAPLTINKIQAVYTGYPFQERAKFQAPEQPELADLWKIGWRTTRLCAHETYMDCPYYEQLQYIGDTRIQCLVTQYTSGDSRLFRNALSQFNDSRINDGLTQSRYPSYVPQIIPPFSLWYIGMVHDYWEYVPDDDDFIRSLLPGIRGILNWFRARLRSDGMLGALEWWNFVDWTTEWKNGTPPGATTGGSSIITLQYAIALREAAELIRHYGQSDEAEMLQRESVQTMMAATRFCYDRHEGRVADTPERNSFSQHAAILLALANNRTDWEGRIQLMERVLTDPTLTQATFYFRFYLNRALVAAKMGNRYLETLAPWYQMKSLGLTTWAEKPEPTRSDCHAWSASPNYEFLATVLGIRSGAPGWDEVYIEPHPGTLTDLSGVVPHPKGEIAVAYKKIETDLWEADVVLPPGISGVFMWQGKGSYLPSGRRKLTLMKPADTEIV